VERHARALLEAAGRDPGALLSAEVRHFCRHARHLRVLRCAPLGSAPSAAAAAALRAALASEDAAAAASLALLLRATDRFYDQHQRWPGSFDGDLAEDAALLKAAAGVEAAEAGAGAPVCDDLAAEVVRGGGGELHVVASVVGAVAAQEAIKLLTEQFVPLGGAMIYDAINCTTAVLNL